MEKGEFCNVLMYLLGSYSTSKKVHRRLSRSVNTEHRGFFGGVATSHTYFQNFVFILTACLYVHRFAVSFLSGLHSTMEFFQFHYIFYGGNEIKGTDTFEAK